MEAFKFMKTLTRDGRTTAIIGLLFAALALPVQGDAKHPAKCLELVMPEASIDGAFVIKIQPQRELDLGQTHIELWRSFNGGKFELVSAHPHIHAVSQMLQRQGQYAYQARLITTLPDNSVRSELSDTAYIDVSLRYPSLAQK